jgi:uncharacterized protein GlcG (DUF336 family)
MSHVISAGIVSLEGAQRVVGAALDEAGRRGLPIAVAVTGPAGDLKAFARNDGVAPLAALTAQRKCWSVTTTWRSTKEFGAILKEGIEAEPELFHGMLRIGQMTAIEGGVPLRSGEWIIGAVGVSGASSVEDQELAEFAAAALA